MPPRLKSVGLALALVGSGACCFADTARGAPFAPILNPQLDVAAQTQKTSPSTEQPTASIQQLLKTAKQHYRRAEFKQAIAAYQQVLSQSQQASDRVAQMEALLQLGVMNLWLGQTTQAEERFQQVIKLARERGDRAREGEALVWLSDVYRNRQEFSNALSTVQQALAISQQTSDRKLEAQAQLEWGAILVNQQEPQKAMEFLQRALKLAQETQAQEEIAYTYTFLSLAYAGLKDFKQAEIMLLQQQNFSQVNQLPLLEYSGLQIAVALKQLQNQPEQVLQIYQKLLAIAQSAGNPWFQRSALLEIGGFYVNQKQTPKALESYQKALALAKAINDGAVADVQNRIGVAYYQAEQYAKAVEAYQQALATYRDLNKQSETAQVWTNLGNTYYWNKQYPQSVEHYQQALKIYQTLNKQPEIAQTWSNIGNAYYWNKQYPQSVEHYQQALKVYQTLNKQPEIAQTWSNIGNAYYWNKQYPQALEAYQQALKLYQVANRPKEMSQAWRNIGDVYGQQEQYQKALEAHQKALEIARAIPDRAAELNALFGQGIVYIGQGQSLGKAAAYKEAIASFEKSVAPWQQAQAIAKELKNVQSEQIAIGQIWISYIDKGLSFNRQQQYTSSISAFEQGLAVLRQFRDRLPADKFLQNERSNLQTLGNAYANAGQYSKAVTTHQEALKIASQLNDLEEQVNLLVMITANYRHLGEYTKALETSQRALALAREKLKQDPKIEMGALITVGRTFGALGQPDAELVHYQQALAIARTSKDIGSEITLLSNISTTYSNQGEYLKALDPLQQALTISQAEIQRLQSGDTQVVERLCGATFASLGTEGQQQCLQMFEYGASSVLNNLAFVYHGLGRYTDSLKTYQQALNIAQRYKDLAPQTTLLNNIGSVYLDTGNYSKALDNFQQSLEIAVTSGARPNQALAFNSIGMVYHSQGQTSKALDYWQQSLALAQAVQSPEKEATVLNNIGTAYKTQGDYKQALKLYQQSLEVRHKNRLGDTTTTLNNIASVYLDQGQYSQALEQLQEALEIVRRTGDRPREVIFLRNIGSAYHRQSNYAKALEFYQQAQKSSQVMGSRSSELAGLLAQGRFHRDLGQHSQALALFQQALMLSRELGEMGKEAAASGNIGDVYRKQEQYSQALQFYQQALNLAREIGDIAGESNILQLIAQTYEKQGNITQAEVLLQQALIIQRKIGARPNEAMTLNVLGRVYTTQGKAAEAQEALQQALAIAQSINDRTTEAETLADLGKLFQTQPELAIAFYKQSVNTYEGIRTGIRSLSREQQDSYTQTIAGTYRQLADLLISQGRLAEAQQVLELLKIQEINDYTQGVRSAAKLSDIQLNEVEEKILKEHQTLIAFTQKLTECSNCPEKAKLLKQADAIQEQYNRTVQTLSEQSRRNRATDDSFLDPDSRFGALAKDILRKQPGTVIIYPLVLEKKVWILMASEGGLLTRYEVPVDQSELNKTVFKLQELLQSPRSDPAQLKTVSQKLYGWLIKPLEKELKTTIKDERKVKHLIFALDRVTRYIPMSVLFDGQQYLIENYTINTIIGAGQTNFSDTLPASLAQTSILGVGLSQAKGNFSGLPNVPFELDTIVKQNDRDPGIYPGEEFLNQSFTYDTLNSKHQGKQILHIATHGEFVPGRANNSYLLLGTGDKLTISDIARLRYLGDVHMVVLSACQTALGGSSDGVEISGMSDFFFKGGVRTVLATLWNVNDASTALMMQQFYQNLSTGKASKAEALRQAQLSLLRGDKTAKDLTDRGPWLGAKGQPPTRTTAAVDFKHPYFWAPFILIGNSR